MSLRLALPVTFEKKVDGNMIPGILFFFVRSCKMAL